MIEKLFQRPPDVVRRSIIHKTSYNRMIETKMYSGETLDAPACMCESLSVWTWIVQEEPCAKLWLFESDFRVLASKRTVRIVACIVTCDREFAVVSVATRHWDGDYAKRTRNLFYRSVRVSLSQSSSPWRPPLSARCQKQDSFPKLNRTKVVSLCLSVCLSQSLAFHYPDLSVSTRNSATKTAQTMPVESTFRTFTFRLQQTETSVCCCWTTRESTDDPKKFSLKGWPVITTASWWPVSTVVT